MKNLPPNSHITCDMFFSFEYLKMQPWYKEKMEHWEEGYFNYTYLLLGEGYNFRDLEKKFPDLIEKHMSDLLRTTGGKIEYFLQPLRSIHLHSKLEFEISPNVYRHRPVHTSDRMHKFYVSIHCPVSEPHKRGWNKKSCGGSPGKFIDAVSG
jgi:hypothetical protein